MDMVTEYGKCTWSQNEGFHGKAGMVEPDIGMIGGTVLYRLLNQTAEVRHWLNLEPRAAQCAMCRRNYTPGSWSRR